MTAPDAAAPRTFRGGRALLGLSGLAGLLVLVEVLPRTGLVSADYLPPTSRILAALADEAATGPFWVAVGDTLTAWAAGLAIAVAAGVAVGILIGAVPVLRAVTASTVEFLRPIPSVALIPLAVLLYGSDLGSSLLLVVYAAFWQVLVQVLYGVADVDPVADETARSFRLGAFARVRHVLWPTALPYVFTGVRLAAAVALVLAVTAEMIIGAPGLGAVIAVAQTSNAIPTMYALIVVTGLLGVTINIGARAAERHFLSWHQSVRGEIPA
ncbi:ABC transporter permease [Amorphoplanes digitatis]|uniref:ABC-type nitrate/sulfonate/bicarbonate transport system permease component n=1 Tax=Actinoplanes digitatis TaxID=1868 RepID=A0A7W7MQJ7_9ACTN|nr:ABC transporter permease subunit [Actinoplanes digitatis]MBB4762772.1 ABC-type nitrate/sulfonate/bicarbonate transport system permease component [Actinoplanes digitatis]GID91732.1 nitrate ABC transporter permease [Actinoplanes digitatis]